MKHKNHLFLKIFCFFFLILFSFNHRIKNKNFLKGDNLPLLSKSNNLFGIPSITQETFLSELTFSSYHLTKGEAADIFAFIDKEQKGMIKSEDWQDFINFYLIPFEKCDSKKQYLLSKEDLQKCIIDEPSSKVILSEKDAMDKFFDVVIDIIQFENNPSKEINFYSYLTMRKALFAWSECAINENEMTASAFKCAISYSSNIYIDKLNLDRIYAVSMMDNKSNRMDFISFLRALITLKLFEVFGARKDKFSIDKSNFEQSALREDKILSFFTKEEIDKMYSFTDSVLFQSMSFESFYFFYNIYKLYNIHAKDKKAITVEEAISSFDHELFPYAYKSMVDSSLTNFKAEDYNALPMLKGNRFAEMKYFNSFLEKSLITFKNKGNETVANKDSRKIFFTMHCKESDCKTLTKNEYLQAFIYSSLFETLSIKNKGSILNVEFISKNLDIAYDDNIPKFTGQYKFGSQLLRRLPFDLQIDLILFNTIHSFNDYFKDNFKNLSINQILNSNYGLSEIPKDKISLYPTTSEDKIKSLIHILTIQGRTAESKRNIPPPVSK